MSRPPSRSILSTALILTLVAGSLDLLAAIINYLINTNGKSPVAVFKFIASGIYGRRAFGTDEGYAAQGILLHFLVTFLFALLFVIIYHQVRFFRRMPVITGVLYGVFVWCVMNLVVVPLSNTPAVSRSNKDLVVSILIIIICVGLPFAILTRRLLKRGSAPLQ